LNIKPNKPVSNDQRTNFTVNKLASIRSINKPVVSFKQKYRFDIESRKGLISLYRLIWLVFCLELGNHQNIDTQKLKFGPILSKKNKKLTKLKKIKNRQGE
jgi:hypothetical protein